MPAKVRLHAAPATVVSLAVILALGAAGLVALSSPSTARSRGSRTQRRAEAANQPHCGDTITADTTLHRDLVNCPNNGIIIGADNVTLNLNGHTIDGDGKPFAGCASGEPCDLGVAERRQDGVTVKHGSVREFANGVDLGVARHLGVLGVSTVRNVFVGIFFFRCVRCLVRNSAANRTKGGPADLAGMLMFQSHHDRILKSSFRGNAGLGINSVRSTNTLVRGNIMSRNDGEGFLLEGGEGLRVGHNRLVRNGGGITLGPGSGNVITRNRVFGGSEGIRIEKGHGNLVAHNVVAHTRGPGIRLGIRHPSVGGAHNIVRRNRVRDSGGDGFLVGRKERHSLLKLNVARMAKGDGFHIDSRLTTLTRNLAVDNSDLGIDAVFSVIDGGGNRAHGNGDPRQCVNIVCN